MSYPEQNKSDAQIIVNNKAENIEYSRWLQENQRIQYVQDENPLFRHQNVFLNLMTNYDKVLGIHDLGTGKTCSAIKVAEYLKKTDKPPKHVYILERGKSVLSDVRSQILNVCAPGTYEPIEMAATSRGYQQQLTKNLNKYYTLMTYKELTSTPMNDETIESTFSDCMFMLDEAHNLNNITFELDEDNAATTDEYSSNDLNHAYQVLWKIFHIAKRTKIIVMTATPMMNSWTEIASILNLLLPQNSQLNVDTITFDKLKDASAGLVSYVQKPIIKIKANYIGKPIDIKLLNGEQSKTILLRLSMKGLQKKTYQSIKSNKDFYIHYRIASTFVFPDGSYSGRTGTTSYGLYKYVKKQENGNYVMNNELRQAISNNLRNLSCKFDYAINKELHTDRTFMTPDGSVTLPGNGCSFFFFDYIVSQAIPFAMCLEVNGFEMYNSSINPFTNYGSTRQISLTKKKRYILVTGDNVSKLNQFRDLFNHPDNVNGEYVQIFIGTNVVRDGINLFHILRIYINPKWNKSSMDQAIGRGFRSGGHDKYIEELNKYNINSAVTVDIHLMSAYVSDETTLTVKSSIDDYLYISKIENKWSDIDIAMSILKKSSIDFLVNNNTGSLPVSKSIDWSTYNDTRIINYISEIIESMFYSDNILGYTSVIQRIKDILPPMYASVSDGFVYKSILNIISDKRIIYTKTGNGWLNVAGNTLMVTHNYSSQKYSDISLWYYIRPIANERNSIEDRIADNYIQNLDKIDILSNIKGFVRRIAITEHIKQHVLTGKQISDDVNSFKNLIWFVMPEPVGHLEETAELLSYPTKTKGRKASASSKAKLKNKKFVSNNDIEEPDVYIYYDDNDLYIMNTKCIDILNWRKPRKFEEFVYLGLIEKIKSDINIQYNIPVDMLYGIVKADGTFLINKNSGGDKQYSGRNCSIIIRFTLISYIKELGLNAPDISFDVVEKEFMLKQLKDDGFNLSSFRDMSFEDILYYYKWMKTGYKKTKLCEVIRQALENKNYIIYQTNK